MFKVQINNIRFGYFDLAGVLYHSNYFAIFEEVREQYLASIGCPYHILSAGGLHLAVAKSEQSFLKPIFYGDKIEVEVGTLNIKNSSFVFDYKINTIIDDSNLNSGRVLVHHATTQVVCVQVEKRSARPTRIPDDLRKNLEKIAL